MFQFRCGWEDKNATRWFVVGEGCHFSVRLWVLFVHFRLALCSFCSTFPVWGFCPSWQHCKVGWLAREKDPFMGQKCWNYTLPLKKEERRDFVNLQRNVSEVVILIITGDLVLVLSQQDVLRSVGGDSCAAQGLETTTTLQSNSQTLSVYRHNITSEDRTHASRAPRLIVSAAPHDQRPQFGWWDGGNGQMERWVWAWIKHTIRAFLFLNCGWRMHENIFSCYWSRNIEWND